jgi:hypothetical protein
VKSPSFEDMLAGGNPRTLGKAEETVAIVLANPRRLNELFECIFSTNEIVRMRAADALEKACRQQPSLFEPYVPRLLNEVSKIHQPSVQWHLAQILAEVPLERNERATAVRLLKGNLSQSKDWIVITCTMQSLVVFAQQDSRLRKWFVDVLRDFKTSEYKSIATRARKLLAQLEG